MLSSQLVVNEKYQQLVVPDPFPTFSFQHCAIIIIVYFDTLQLYEIYI